MVDLLAFLDEAIAELGSSGSARSARDALVTGTVTGTPKLLIYNDEPAVPVVPVKGSDILREAEPTQKNPVTERNFFVTGRARESLTENDKSTGTTGTPEGFCGENRARSRFSSRALTGTTGTPEGFCGSGPCKAASEPTLLRDGRRMHRFRAAAIALPDKPRTIIAMMDEARWRRVVLVADGNELIVVEPWQSTLDPEALDELRTSAGAVIAILRDESRSRSELAR